MRPARRPEREEEVHPIGLGLDGAPLGQANGFAVEPVVAYALLQVAELETPPSRVAVANASALTVILGHVVEIEAGRTLPWLLGSAFLFDNACTLRSKGDLRRA